jgi:glucosamine--fructose-6-phosphate aminotransferase (isomerizing)
MRRASSSTGPIALIDENMPVIVIAPHDRVFEKTVSNMQEVAARGGKIILVTDPKARRKPRYRRSQR